MIHMTERKCLYAADGSGHCPPKKSAKAFSDWLSYLAPFRNITPDRTGATCEKVSNIMVVLEIRSLVRSRDNNEEGRVARQSFE